jgi:UDP-3-O-[3-hydroxymyristoyl] N-acetylglucosamine deacetylase
LAALYFCGVTNCLIEILNGIEIPNDGSGACGQYVTKILQTGLEKQDAPLWSLSPVSRDRFSWDDSSATVEPRADDDSAGLTVNVIISFAFPIGRQLAVWSSRAGEVPDDGAKFVEARTFLRRDLSYTWPNGVDHWNYLHDSIRGLPASKVELRLMAFDDGEWIVAPRYECEAAWHKLVDLVGDLSLIGGRLVGSIAVYKPGHAYNHRLVRWLQGTYRDAMPISARLDLEVRGRALSLVLQILEDQVSADQRDPLNPAFATSVGVRW